MGIFVWMSSLGAVILAASYLQWRAKHQATANRLRCKPIPTFRAWDVLGIQNFMIELNGMKSNRLSDTFLRRKAEMSKRTGRNCKTFRIYYPPGDIWYYTFDPKNLQAVLATQFEDFQQPAARVGAFKPLLGLGIFSANGEMWKHSRDLLRPQFKREQIVDLTLFETHTKSLLDVLPSADDRGWTPIFDLHTYLERFTMDTATEFLLGESVDSQKDDSIATSRLVSRKEMQQFVDAFCVAKTTTAKSMICGDLFWLLHDQKFKQQCQSTHDFIETYVQRHLQDSGKAQKSSTGRFILLDALIADVKDPEALRCQLLNVLLAGSDTISGTLGFFIASLAQHPDIFDKLRGTILSHFGSFDEAKPITLSGLKSCTYLQWVLNEVLRMYPPVPVNFREAVRDTTLPVGGGADGNSPVFVPKGRLVAWELWTIHSDPEYWGPDATSFNPDRWDKRKFGFEYLPFNAGPRVCIGQQLALAEVAYFITRFVQSFDRIDGSALPAGRLPCDWKLTDKVAGGVNIRLHRAEK